MRGIAVIAVVRSNEHIVLVGVSACPIVAASACPIPAGRLLLVGLRGVFVGDGQADKVCRKFLAAPEAGIEVVTADGDRAVWLPSERVVINPDGLKRLCVKGLDRAVRQTDKDHALGVGRRRDGKTRGTLHFAACQNFAGDWVDAVDGLARVGDKHIVHQQRAARRAAVKAIAEFRGPIECRLVGVDRRFDRQNTVVAALAAAGRAGLVVGRSAEIRPIRQEAAARSRFSPLP